MSFVAGEAKEILLLWTSRNYGRLMSFCFFIYSKVYDYDFFLTKRFESYVERRGEG